MTVLYLSDMTQDNTSNHQSKGANLPSIKHFLSYGLALLFVFVSLNPVQAGMAVRHDVMDTNIASSDSTAPTSKVKKDTDHSVMLVGETSPRHVMAMDKTSLDKTTSSSAEDCQAECDCCPGLCSVYLPNNLTSSTFFTSNAALAESAFQSTVATRSPLFRPPFPTKAR